MSVQLVFATEKHNNNHKSDLVFTLVRVYMRIVSYKVSFMR